mgnify:FL=1
MPLIISSCTNSSNPNSSHMNYFVWKYMKEGKDGEKKKTGPDECCRAERQIGYEVRTLNQVIGRLVNSYQSKVDEKAGINRMQGWIIGYLYRHSEEAVFQKDLEAEFQMARSTASGILQAMEKKGLITRESIQEMPG